MRRITLAAAWIAAFTITGTAQVATLYALPGPAPAETAIAEYNPATGVIVVSVANVQNWFVNSSSASMTGPDDVEDVLPLAGGLVSNSQFRVGELVFGGDFTYTNVDLGAVAATGIPVGGGPPDLTVHWNAAGLNKPRQTQPVVYIPEPDSIVLIGLGICGMLASRRLVD